MGNATGAAYLNTRAKQRHTYDAIIVGSGISGGWAAKELCERGLKVLLLDRGRPLVHPEYPTATMDIWDFPARTQLTNTQRRLRPIQSRHWSYRPDNADFYIDDLANPYEEIQRYDWIRGTTVGGRSLLWSRACYRWSDVDFEANLRDGHGVDWPVRYQDLAPWYDRAERFIGVSGNRDGLPQLPDGPFMPPFDMNVAELDFKARLEAAYPSRNVIIGRTANNTEKLPGRVNCQARNLCHRGCPFGAYFSSNSSTLPAAQATGNLTLQANTLVNRIIYDDPSQRAVGVEAMDMTTRAVEEYYAKLIFVNASTVATTAILLNSASARFPNGLGNDSDQLGRNLMDHHKGVFFSAPIDGFEDKYYYGRRPTGIYIPRFSNLRAQDSDFIRGYYIAGEAHRPRQYNEGIGAAFKDSLCEPGQWHLQLYAMGECLPYPDNRITLDKNRKDPWGNPMVAIDCTFRDNERAMHAKMKSEGKEMLERAGYRDVYVGGELSFPGNSNHEMGTARMGRDPETSVLNGYNQMHAVKNVFVTDGSCMTSASCVNPSLTFMALTIRACDYAVNALKKGML